MNRVLFLLALLVAAPASADSWTARGDVGGRLLEGIAEIESGRVRITGRLGGGALAAVGTATPTTDLRPGMRAVVRVDGVSLRAAPAATASALRALARNTDVDLIAVAGDWCRVRAAGIEGHVAKAHLGAPAGRVLVTFAPPLSRAWLDPRGEHLLGTADPGRLELARRIATDLVGTTALGGLAVDAGGKRYHLVNAQRLAERAIDGLPVRVIGVSWPTGSDRTLLLRAFSVADGLSKLTLAPGVTYRTGKLAIFGAREVVHLLEIDPRRATVSVVPATGKGERLSKIGERSGGGAAINAGYFDGTTGKPVSLVKVAGQLLCRNPRTRPPRAAFGLDLSGGPIFDRIAWTDAWVAAREAIGAGPNLVTAGRPDVTTTGEGFPLSFETGRNPRSAVGARADGTILLFAVDGRSTASAGMSLGEAARFLIALGSERAINLDGGGSTAMWLAGRGVVNAPSDGSERVVANALVVRWP